MLILTILNDLQFLNQFDYGDYHLDGLVHFTRSHHQHQNRINRVIRLILAKQPIVVKIDLE